MKDTTLAVAQFIAVPGDVNRNVDRHVYLTSIAAHHGSKLILFPELSLTGYDRALTLEDALDEQDERLHPLHRVATDRAITVIVGVPLCAGDDLLIGAFAFHPDGRLSVYEKQHLHEGEEIVFRPGSGGASFMVEDESIGIAICAEITHPEHARATSEAGATVYAASCFITPGGYDVDAALLERYARELGMVVLMSNYGADTGGWSSGGRSAIWSEDGVLLACAPDEGEVLIIGRRERGKWKATVVDC